LWNQTTSTLALNFTSQVSTLAFSLDLLAGGAIALSTPNAGLGSKGVVFSSYFSNNGAMDQAYIPQLTKICSLYGMNIQYTSNVPGTGSDIRFYWTSQPTDLIADDQIVLTLTDYNANLGTLAR